ncbi:insulinase family protein [Sphaerochaeta sp. PS]|uniref:insulinase family protein n=1 Tax=Sphaerochaeta sp. PS TaxID=3076336 RepID=UPI0028A4A102|nr:insulinase family protein [Sphaerochaeta sp. PS]MDT4761204.1 insulinase family protein [Sphaerochaeta sp. PS]
MSERQWAVGDEVSGFALVEVSSLEDYRATGYLFRHIATGMEVYQMVNDDSELFFGYVFRTLPNNDCGIAHILEHCCLAGSKNYPVRDPFMTLLKGSTNTFMNAMTYPDKTLYPAASPLKKDFDNLFSVYTDAVFAPLLREETFQQEGVRMVCEGESCHFEGVVFNEMLGGGSDHDSIVGRASVRSLFPDTPYTFESGGLPEQIVQLNYQQFLAFYSMFYHPSNCKLFLYGDMEVGAKLEMLENAYLRSYGKLNVDSLVPLSEPWKAPRKSSFTSPVEEGEGDNGDSVVLSWATCEASDPLALITLSTLVDILLGNPGAPLYKALLDSKLGKDISPESGMSADFREMPFTVGFKGIDADKADEAEHVILTSLKAIVSEGLAVDIIASSMKRSRFKQQEIPGGIPNGLRALNRATRSWMVDLSPTVAIGTTEPLEALQKALEANPRYFEDWIQHHLLDNPHRSMVVVKADSEHERRQLATIEKYAKEQADALGKKGLKLLAQQNEHFLQFELEGDSEEDLAKVPYLKLEDLPTTIVPNLYEQLTCAGRPLYLKKMFCNKIVYADFAFHLEDLSERELMLLPLYIRTLQLTGIGDMEYPQVANQLKYLTGDTNLYLEMGSSHQGDDRMLLVCRTRTLVEDFEPALTFLHKLFTEANVGDLERLQASLTNLKTDYVDNITYSAHSFASLSAASIFSNVQFEGEQLSGLDQWFFLENIHDEQLFLVAEEFLALQKKLNNRNRLVFHLGCDDELVPSLVSQYDQFAQRFELKDEIVMRQRSYEKVSKGLAHAVELFRLPSTVSYAAYVIRSSKRGSDNQASQVLLGQILSGNDLWEKVRGQGGAYGVSAHADVMEELFFFTSYRDPRIAGTLADFTKSLELYTTKEIPAKDIENALISTVGNDLRPLSPSQDSILSFRRILYNITDEFRTMRRKQMLAMTSSHLNEGAKALLDLAKSEDSVVVIAGSALLDTEKAKNPTLDRPSRRLPL